MGNSTCAYRLDVHAKQAKRQQNKKSNDNSNFSIRPWTQSQPFTVGTKTTEGKIRAYLWTSIRIEWNPLHVKRWMRDHIHRNAVSWFRFLVFFSFVWRRKFCDMFKIYEAQTESVSGKKHTVSDFLQLLRLLSLILTLSPLVWLRIHSKQSTNSNLRQRHAFILLSLFRTSLHILDCNSRLSALIMRRHIRYIQFILTTIYCTEITISQFKDGGRKELMAIAEMVKKMPIA